MQADLIDQGWIDHRGKNEWREGFWVAVDFWKVKKA